jgi:hypothetical protein
MKKLITSFCFIILSHASFAEIVTKSNINGIVTSITVQSIVIGSLIALLAMLLVSIRKYELIDNRIRNQRDILYRRIIFFLILIITPILYFYVTTDLMHNTTLKAYGSYKYAGKQMYANMILGAYISGVTYCALAYAASYVLFAWLLGKFVNRYKSWTVIYSNHKIFGIISLNKKNK